MRPAAARLEGGAVEMVTTEDADGYRRYKLPTPLSGISSVQAAIGNPCDHPAAIACASRSGLDALARSLRMRQVSGSWAKRPRANIRPCSASLVVFGARTAAKRISASFKLLWAPSMLVI